MKDTAMKPLVEHLAFYEAYHKNPWNKATHFVGIPAIIFSILIPMAWAGTSLGGVRLTLALAFVLVVLAYYFVQDVPLAAGMVVFIVPTLYLAQLAGEWPYLTGLLWFLVFFVGGWVFQIIGHSVFEKRRPALVDNLFQLLIGPIYLVAEVYYRLGFRHDLRDEVKRLEAGASAGSGD